MQSCWSDTQGVERMRSLVAPDYVHHTPWGDWTFDQFAAGLDHVGTIFRDRSYEVVHVVADGDVVAALLRWTATRVADGSAVHGDGAYHCRVVDGLVREDWDVFRPMS